MARGCFATRPACPRFADPLHVWAFAAESPVGLVPLSIPLSSLTIGGMTGVWPLVGRGEELDVISAVLARAGEHRGVVIAGPAGVGKSRLAREALTAAAALGWTVRWIVGTVSARAIPLGAFAQWTDDLDGNPLALVRQVISAIASGAGAAPVLVAVDDVHLLDELSAFVLHQMVLRGAATVVATLRSGETVSDVLGALWRDGHLRRLELQALSRAEIAHVLEQVLGDPVNDAVAQRMWELSRGNPLFVRQLVEQERAAGRLVADDGRWCWNGPVQVSPSLIDLVELQIGAVGDAVGEVVDLVAIGEPLRLGTLAAAVDADALEAAERQGLITVSRLGDADTVQVGHPLYAEVRLARCGQLRRRRLRGRLASAMTGSEVTAAADPVRLGLLWLESDLSADPSVLLAAAEAAFLRLDLDNAQRLAAAAVTAGADVTARLLHAHSLVLLNRGGEATTILESFGSEDLPTPLWAQTVHSRAANLMFPLGRPDASWAVIDGALVGASDELTAELLAFRAVQLAFAGRPAEVPPLLATIDLDAVAPLPALVGYWAHVIALGDLGRPREAARAAACGYARAATSPTAAYQGVRLSEFHVDALVLGGDVGAALAAADRTYQLCVDVPGMPHSLATALAGMAALGSGDLIAAHQRLSAAVRDFAKITGVSGALYRFSILLVEVLARSGRVAEAETAAEQMRAGRHPSFVRVQADATLAQAWVAAAGGRAGRARQLAARAAEFARHHQQWAREVLCLQTATSFGDTTVAARLGELSGVVQGARAPLASRYATALAATDGPALAKVSDDFEAMGDRLAAADAAASAAAAFTLADRRGSALTAATRSRRLAADCAAVLQPRLQAADLPVKLSSRERETAALAAQGLHNDAIAEALAISTRTVEGHFYRACTRLGLTRTQLIDLIAAHTP